MLEGNRSSETTTWQLADCAENHVKGKLSPKQRAMRCLDAPLQL